MEFLNLDLRDEEIFLKEIMLPEDNEMYLRGEREKCIYKLELEG